MYISPDVPATFRNVAEIHDNYVVLTEESQLVTGVDYEVYIQYFSPSVMLVHLDDYRINNGDEVEYSYNLDSSGDLVSSEVSYKLHTFTVDSVESGFYDRPDCVTVLIGQFLIVFLYVWLLNQLSKLLHKGGVFNA